MFFILYKARRSAYAVCFNNNFIAASHAKKADQTNHAPAGNDCVFPSHSVAVFAARVAHKRGLFLSTHEARVAN